MVSMKLPILWAVAWLTFSVPLMFLQHGLDLDVAVSPAWEVALYYGLLIPFGAMWYAASAYLFLPRIRGWLWIAFALLVCQLVAMAVVGWGLEGPELGLRSSRVEDLVALFAVLSPFTVMLFRLGRLGSFRGLLEGPQGEFSS